MFHVFALTYYILLRCVTRKYSMTPVTTKNYARVHYHKWREILDLRDTRVHYHIRFAQRVLFITRAVHETCFCCQSCNGRFFWKFLSNSWENFKVRKVFFRVLKIWTHMLNLIFWKLWKKLWKRHFVETYKIGKIFWNRENIKKISEKLNGYYEGRSIKTGTTVRKNIYWLSWHF